MNLQKKILAAASIALILIFSVIIGVNRNNDSNKTPEEVSPQEHVTHHLTPHKRITVGDREIMMEEISISGTNIILKLSGEKLLPIRKENIRLYEAGVSAAVFETEEIGAASGQWSATYYGQLNGTVNIQTLSIAFEDSEPVLLSPSQNHP